ncbi:MAG TPA: zinc-binding dehydrogenase [Acidimicrobiales bacterium]|nr:zinc-binding dehydrogenase [Acidimicrobiales bacterium]
MRAIQVGRFGGPEVLTLIELPDPVPEPGQVLVAASASDVLFVDTMIRSGRGVDYFPIRPPYISGNGLGGTVVGRGEGVDASWLGRQVVAHTGSPGGGGSYAELAAVDLEACALVPSGVDLLDATAVLHDGTTALRVLETTGAEAGEWVLVLGAAGGMGVLLVQLLLARGAHVIGAAGGRTKRDVASLAGAHAAVDYSQADWTDAVLEATGGRSPSVVLDGVGGQIGGEAFDLLGEGGRFSAHGAPSGSFAAINREIARNSGIAVTTIADLQYQAGDRERLLAAALGELRAGRIEPLIGQTFSLADASKAHMAIEARETVAKTLLLSDHG